MCQRVYLVVLCDTAEDSRVVSLKGRSEVTEKGTAVYQQWLAMARQKSSRIVA